MKFFTSYFENIVNVRQKNKDTVFISVAGFTPPVANTRIFKCIDLMPRKTWWDEWHAKFGNDAESNESIEWYSKKYDETVLSKMTVEKLVSQLNSIGIDDKSNVCFLCWETPEKFCHRHIISKWLNKNGFNCMEF